MKYLESYKLFEAKKEKKYTGKNRIILLGPPSIGKSTISKELGKELGLEILHLDILNFGIMKDFSIKGRIKAVKTALNDKKYQDCILDFGGGHAYYKGVKEMIEDFRNIFVLIPTGDMKFSQKLLKDAQHKRLKAEMIDPIEHILKSLQSSDCEFSDEKKERLIEITKKIINRQAGELKPNEIPKKSLEKYGDMLKNGFLSGPNWDEYENYLTKENDKINRSLTDNIIEVFTEKGNRRSKSAIVNEIISKLK